MPEHTNNDLKYIPLSEIRPNPAALRNVDKKSEQYVGLVDSVRQYGILSNITVRELQDKETGKPYFGLMDGLHRFSAALDAGLKEIPAKVVSFDDAKSWMAQIVANVQRVETTPSQLAEGVRRILGAEPTLTVTELAEKFGKSANWLSKIMNITKVQDEKIRALIDSGKIVLSNAQHLAMLPPEEMANFVDRAMTDTPAVFIPTVSVRIKEIRDAKRKGRAAGPEEFTPIPRLRRMPELKAELDTAKVGATMQRSSGAANTFMEGWNLAIKWATKMDPQSIAAAKEADRVRREKLKAEQEKKKLERAEQRQREAAEEVAKLTAAGAPA